MPSVDIERRLSSRVAPLRLLRLREVSAMCGLSRTSIYQAIKDGGFPPPVAIGARARAWIRQEVEDWAWSRVRASRIASPSRAALAGKVSAPQSPRRKPAVTA